MTWADVAIRHPVFVQWAVQRYGPLPDGEVAQEDYERLAASYERGPDA